MSKVKNHKEKKRKLDITAEKCSVPRSLIHGGFYTQDKRVLENALVHLLRGNTKKKGGSSNEENCRLDDSIETRTDHQVKLKCRQLPNVVQELRKVILRQDWPEAATLLTILCHTGIKLYCPIIVKTCFLLLFCHPNSKWQLLENFVRNATGYVLDEDINKFIKILFILRKSAFKAVHATKYSYYKITRDSEFDEIK